MKVLITWLAFNRDFQNDSTTTQVDPGSFTGTLHREIYQAHGFNKHVILTTNDENNETRRKKYLMQEFLKSIYPTHMVSIEAVDISSADLQSFEITESAIRSFIQKFDPKDELNVVAGTGPTVLSMVWSTLHIVMEGRFKLYLLADSKHSESGRSSLKELKPYANKLLDLKLREIYLNGEIQKHILVDEFVNSEYDKAAMFARSKDIPVLILGETGSGKEAVARYIHENSPLKERDFIPLNCASMPDDVLYSELFGHEKGSFTGASERRIGLFEKYKAGTIFLDEIGDISAFMQQSLLRALENKEIRRMGSNEITKNINPRIIAATNHQLYDKCKEGKFRWDLYYRLSGAEIYLMPYRERTLHQRRFILEHYISNGEQEFGFKLKLDPEVRSKLEQYSFPGNFREVKTVINSLFAQGENELKLDCLPRRFFYEESVLDETYKGVLRRHCLRVYEKYGRNLSETRKALGYTNITQVKNKFEQLGIKFEEETES